MLVDLEFLLCNQLTSLPFKGLKVLFRNNLTYLTLYLEDYWGLNIKEVSVERTLRKHSIY